MKPKIYELPISKNYVHNWGIKEAIREIMQNAIDSQTDGYDMEISYNNGTLTIQNKGCNIDVSSLVLGNSGKDDKKYVGIYGEGYKLAIIVLLREGLKVKVYTNKQEWTSEFKESKKFKFKDENNRNKGVETLHITTTSDESFEDDIVKFEISGLDYDLFTSIRSKNLAMLRAMNYSVGETIKSEYGEILLNKDYKGMMFVNGLYIQQDSSFQYGYNFKSEYVSLDRDRKAIYYYKLMELTAQALTSQENVSIVRRALISNSVDTRDVKNVLGNITEEFATNFAHEFLEDKKLDDDTFVGTKKDVVVSNKKKYFITNVKAIAELVNRGQGRKEEYDNIKKKTKELTKNENAYEEYNFSNFKLLVDFLVLKKDKFDEDEIEEVIGLLDCNDLTPSGFDLIKEEIFNQFIESEDE